MNKKSRDALVEGRERWTQWGPSVYTTFPCSSSPADMVPKPPGDSDFLIYSGTFNSLLPVLMLCDWKSLLRSRSKWSSISKYGRTSVLYF